jgi:hypothetical protein
MTLLQWMKVFRLHDVFYHGLQQSLQGLLLDAAELMIRDFDELQKKFRDIEYGEAAQDV